MSQTVLPKDKFEDWHTQERIGPGTTQSLQYKTSKNPTPLCYEISEFYKAFFPPLLSKRQRTPPISLLKTKMSTV
jgi:hypothetical protein